MLPGAIGTRRRLTWRGWTARLVAGLFASAAVLAACGPSEAQALRFSFTLPRASTTSAGVFEPSGKLIRTLWRGEILPAGQHSRTWDGLDDSRRAAAADPVEIRLIHHTMAHRWEGVIGNASTLLQGERAHKSFLPPTSITFAGNQAIYAAGYNEGQNGIHGFDLAQPGWDTQPVKLVDPFAAAAMVVAQGTRLYWANAGGLTKTSFVGMFDLGTAQPVGFTAGKEVCLAFRPAGNCYENQNYKGVIDLALAAEDAPTGIAVQANGPVLAVAHGARNRIHLFDKTTGAALGQFTVPMPTALNQIAFAPSGDLWVIATTGVQRYTNLSSSPILAASQTGLSKPVAIAVSPRSDDAVWVADSGPSQQLKRLDRNGTVQAVIGVPGGYANGPLVGVDKLCFNVRPALEWTGVAVAPDNSVLVVDSCNNRILRYHSTGSVSMPVAYLPAFYSSTVDHANPTRVFANFLEFEVDAAAPLSPGVSWRLVRNWLGGLPAELRDDESFNATWGGFRSVQTLGNGRTYGMLLVQKRQAIVELPASGALRLVKFLAAPPAGQPTPWVLYENGDLGYATTSTTAQSVLRLALIGFDASGNPQWASEPSVLATVPLAVGTPYFRSGTFSGALGPRFPATASGKVVFFDGSVQGNEGMHLGASIQGGTGWLWQASPTGRLDGKGAFQTKAIDGFVQYGGNAVWAHERHIVYGYHGESYKDLQTGGVGQANQFMHFYDNGLFIGQFGQPSTRPGTVGLSGNAVSPTLVRDGAQLYLYHNDESSHGGVHRWRIDGWQDVRELSGSGTPGSVIVLR